MKAHLSQTLTKVLVITSLFSLFLLLAPTFVNAEDTDVTEVVATTEVPTPSFTTSFESADDIPGILISWSENEGNKVILVKKDDAIEWTALDYTDESSYFFVPLQAGVYTFALASYSDETLDDTITEPTETQSIVWQTDTASNDDEESQNDTLSF